MYLEGHGTRVVLKLLKTETSLRKVWITKTLAYILREWKESQEKQNAFLGGEHVDYDLPNGRPYGAASEICF